MTSSSPKYDGARSVNAMLGRGNVDYGDHCGLEVRYGRAMNTAAGLLDESLLSTAFGQGPTDEERRLFVYATVDLLDADPRAIFAEDFVTIALIHNREVFVTDPLLRHRFAGVLRRHRRSYLGHAIEREICAFLEAEESSTRGPVTYDPDRSLRELLGYAPWPVEARERYDEAMNLRCKDLRPEHLAAISAHFPSTQEERLMSYVALPLLEADPLACFDAEDFLVGVVVCDHRAAWQRDPALRERLLAFASRRLDQYPEDSFEGMVVRELLGLAPPRFLKP